MMRALIVVSLLLLGCGGSKKPAPEQVVENKQPAIVAEPPPTEAQGVMARFAAFDRAMCTCVDMACVQRVSDDMTKWSQAEAQKHQEPPKMSEADQKRATEIGMHMAECMQKAMGAAQP